ncbi:MAG: hypothetical protein Q8941_00835 [Bacteroidota bacterium]|nr:hypothetical protein [Bacteroidota bacterium]
MKKNTTILFFLLCIRASAQVNDSPALFLDTFRAAIFQADSSQPVPLPGEEISKAEKIFLETISSTSLLKKIRLKDYHFQLGPHLNLAGEKEVWINCFCSGIIEYFPDWKHRLFSRDMVDDGGQCFFEMTVNLVHKTHYKFGMNGFG